MTRFTLGRFASVFLPTLILAGGGQATLAKDYVAVIDTSASMKADSKLKYAIAGVETFSALLQPDDTLHVISFNTSSTIDGPFEMAEDREQLAKTTSRLRATGGTDYLQALQALAHSEGPIHTVFLSDGAHMGEPDDVINYVEQHLADQVTIHTISVGCPKGSNAERLLSRMAVVTDGSHSRVESSEELVRTFLRIAMQTREYRGFEPSKDEVTISGLQGSVLAFAYDGEPSLSVPVERSRQFRLPGETVSLAVASPSAGETVVVKLLERASPTARLGAVYTDGLPTHKLTILNHSSSYEAGTELSLLTHFHHPESKRPVPVTSGASAEVELLDDSGNSVSKVRLDSEGDALRGVLMLPQSEGVCQLRVSSVWEVDGKPFVQISETAIIVTPPAVQPTPTPPKKPAPQEEPKVETNPELFSASQSQFELTAPADDVVRFQLTFSPLPNHTGATKLTADFAEFTGGDVAQDIITNVKWAPSATIRGAKGKVKLDAAILSPPVAGVYKSTLTISGKNQSLDIPVTLTVK
ncbi:MAG: VWA domain-containing protein [Fuerstiella sp.]